MDFLTADAAASIFDALRTELGHAVSPEWWREHSGKLLSVLMIDLTLAGDNAIVVGMAASKVREDMRAKVIFWASPAPSFCAFFSPASPSRCCR